MHRIISQEQLRALLNDTRIAMSQQPLTQATDDQAQVISLPRGKMEAIGRLEHDEWVFVPVVQTQKKGGKLIEHGFEVHRRENGWEVVTAALETNKDASAKVRSEAARNSIVQQQLEKLRLRVAKPKSDAQPPAAM